MPQVDNSSLHAALQANVTVLNEIFGLRLESFREQIAGDFTPLRCNVTAKLLRKRISPVAQPNAQTNAWNPTTALATYKERTAVLQHCKVDIALTEGEIATLNQSWISQRAPHDPTDIHSVAGMSWILADVMESIDNDNSNAIWGGVRSLAGGANGGANLFDGLSKKFLDAFTATELSASANTVVAIGAAPLAEANILAAIKACVAKIRGNKTMNRQYSNYGGKMYVSYTIMDYIREAQNTLLSNGSVAVSNANGSYSLNAFPRVEIKPVTWLTGVDQMFFTPNGNLFVGSEDGGDAAGVPKFKTEIDKRNLNLMFNYSTFVDFAEPGDILLYRALA